MLRFRILIFFWLFAGLQGFSQYFSTGQDPASLRWRQIKTERYQLIFPSEFESKAQYLANVLDLVVKSESVSLKTKVPRIPVILHTRSAISNGVTVWAPRRIELYPCLPQQTYAEEWLEQLVIHEYRHAVQVSSINHGFSKFLGYIFGEQIIGGILGLYIPTWFLEGDATVIETAWSKTGRGRSGLFESTFRAQLLEKGAYSFDKATMGSYKTFVPDAYSLGYYLVAQIRKKYGANAWDEAISRSARHPYILVPFNSGIRKSTGLWKTALYKESVASLDSAWKDQLSLTRPQEIKSITKRNPSNYTTYVHPLFLNDSTIIAEKNSMDDVTRFVLINRKNGKEARLFTPGNIISGTASIGGNLLAWAENKPGLRWQNQSFTRIRTYNFTTGKIATVINHSRYFSPVLSPDGTTLAAVNISPENRGSVDIIRVESGEILKKIPVQEGTNILSPNWSPDGKKLIFTRLTHLGETISVLDPASGNISDIIPPDYHEFNGPGWLYKHFIIHGIDISGTENLFAIDTLTHKTYQVTNARFAASDPDISSDNKTLIYTDYTGDGAMIAEIPVDTLAWIPAGQVKDHSYKLLHETISRQEHLNIQDSVLQRKIYKMNQSVSVDLKKDSVTGTIHPVKKYSKAGHLFNIHSWAPVSLNVNDVTLYPGVMVMSQNTLSSMFVNAGWEYNTTEQTGKFYAGISYQGLFPVFSLDFDIGNRAGWAKYSETTDYVRFTWQETNLKFHVSVPMNFSRGRYYRYLAPSIGTTLINVLHDESTPEQFTSGLIQTMDYGLNAYQYQRSTGKDLYPRFGQAISLIYRNSPWTTNSMGSFFAGSMNLYFPGIFRHHGILFYTGYQQQFQSSNVDYNYSNTIRTARGWSGAVDPELLSFQLNYKFPLCYPDFSLGSVIYLKRLKMNIFYDQTLGWKLDNENSYQSVGAELTADFHLLRFLAPIEMGVRSIYFPGLQSWGWEMLYSVGLP